MTQATEILRQLRIPAMQAPMFVISGPEMVINACRAGIVGCLPTPNARTPEILDEWMAQIKAAVTADDGGSRAAPWAVNIVVHPSYPSSDADLDLILKHKPPIVVTALGSPKHVVEQIHGYGGIVLADVISPRFAKKAAASGVDGLVLNSAGAGGHTGFLSPFAFVSEIREWWDGLLVLGGGIGTGGAIHAAQTMGADIAYLGTRFIPTAESMCQQGYKEMVVDSRAEDIVISDAISGVKASWMRQSLVNSGLDPDNMPASDGIDFAKIGAEIKRWRDVWAAGQGVGASTAVTDIATIVDELESEYQTSKKRMVSL